MNNHAVNKRPAPAFQCYASDLIAEEVYMLATLRERGLLMSLLNYCWVNDSISADPRHMSRLLQVGDDITELVCGDLIQKHLKPVDGDPLRLHVPDLDRQKTERAERHERMAAGGREGGRRTQTNRRSTSHPSSQAKASEKRGDEEIREEGFQEGESSGRDPWLDDYDS